MPLFERDNIYMHELGSFGREKPLSVGIFGGAILLLISEGNNRPVGNRTTNPEHISEPRITGSGDTPIPYDPREHAARAKSSKARQEDPATEGSWPTTDPKRIWNLNAGGRLE